MDAKPRDPQHVGPRARQSLFERGAGLDEFGQPPVRGQQAQSLCQFETLHLAARILRNLTHDDDQLRHLEIGEPRRGELADLPDEFVAGCRRSGWPEDDRRSDVLAEGGMRDRERHGLRDRAVVQQDFIHLLRRDLLPSAIDDLLETAGDEEEPLRIQVAQVPCTEPPLDEGAAIGLGIVRIGRHHTRPANHDFAVSSRRHQIPRVVHDRDVRPGGPPHRTWFPFPGGEPVARDLRSRLGHPIGFDERDVKHPFHIGNELPRHRRGGGADESQRRARDDTGMV